MRIVFAGTPDNAASTLDALVMAGVDVVGVLTRQDSVAGRSRTVSPSPVAIVAERHKIPTYKSNTLNQVAMEWISELAPDLGVIVAYGAILKSDALEIPKLGWINLHYSLLPEYPGASPVQQAILEGQSVTGVTVFMLDEGVDSGPILASVEVPIPSDANSADLLKSLTSVGIELLNSTLSNFDRLNDEKRVQVSSGKSRMTRKITRPDARLNFDQDYISLSNLVRAMNPEPVAWCEFEGTSVRILEAVTVIDVELPRGEARIIDSNLVVGCTGGALMLKIVQPAGKNAMDGADWFRGLRRESLLLS